MFALYRNWNLEAEEFSILCEIFFLFWSWHLTIYTNYYTNFSFMTNYFYSFWNWRFWKYLILVIWSTIKRISRVFEFIYFCEIFMWLFMEKWVGFGFVLKFYFLLQNRKMIVQQNFVEIRQIDFFNNQQTNALTIQVTYFWRAINTFEKYFKTIY